MLRGKLANHVNSANLPRVIWIWIPFLSVCFSFRRIECREQLSRVLGAMLSALALGRGGGGGGGGRRMFWRWGGWKLSSCASHVLSVSGQGHARGKQSCLAPFPVPRSSAFIHGLFLRAFYSSIVTRGLSKGLMPLTCAKHSGWQSQSSLQILKPSANAFSFSSLLFAFIIVFYSLLSPSLPSLVPLPPRSLLSSYLNAPISSPLSLWHWSAGER